MDSYGTMLGNGKVSAIERFPLFRESVIRGSTVYIYIYILYIYVNNMADF